mgnify:FL=1
MNANQKKFLIEYLQNPNIAECSKRLGISKATCFNYLKNQEVKQAIDLLQNTILESEVIRLLNESETVTSELMSLIKNERSPPMVKLKAIELRQSILEKHQDNKKLLDIENRYSQLEKELNELTGD